MAGEPEGWPLTMDLSLLSEGRPSGNGIAGGESGCVIGC